jgi:gliding motility-associated-like protein
MLFSIKSVNSQCSLFYFFSNDFNCTTNQAIANFTITGATAPYTCTFVNTANNSTVAIGSTVGNTGTVTGMPVGNFNVYISSANNCTTSTSFQVTIPFSSANVVFTNTNVSCFGGTNGASFATVNSSFFTVPFTFTWSTGSNLPSASNLLANNVYSVSIKDSKGCMVTNTTSLTEPNLITSSINNTLVPCFGGTVSSGISSSGGVSPYTYSVNNIGIIGSNAILTAGIKTILTKDFNGCIATNTVFVDQVSQPIINFTITKPSCPGKSDGTISSTVTSAPSPFSYTWLPAISNTSTISNLPVGNYTLIVQDASSCVTKSVAVVIPATSMSTGVVTNPENCSAVDGSSTLTINGGSLPFTFTTQPSIGIHNSNVITSLSTGSYTTLITDANNCRDSIIFNILNLSTVSVSVGSFTPVLCYNQCNGAIQLSVQNAVIPITYSVSNTPTTSSSYINSLCPGFYNIKVIDAIGCPATTTINLSSPPVFSYSASAPTSVCFGKSIFLQAFASGGAGGYNYVWNPGNISGQGISLVPAATTVYSLNVFDANGCTLAPYQLTVNVNPPISININNSSVGICPGSTAQITPTITGGNGNYSFNWQPGNINSESIFVQNISVPFYTLSVNDACGSPTAIKIIPINLFPEITPLFTVTDTLGCEPFCALFTNTTPKSSNAIWNFGDKPFEKQGNVTNYCYLNSGIYNVKLTINDSNNCKTSATYSSLINVLAKPIADFKTNPEVVTTNNLENVLIENASSGATSYSWSINTLFVSQEKNFSYSFKDTGCYIIKLISENENNCIDVSEKQICVVEGFNFYMPNSITTNNDKLNDVLIPKGTGWTSKNYLFEIYSRWGTKIFNTNDFTQGWDGTYQNNVFLPLGVYFWRIIITDNLGDEHELKGCVTVFN